MYGHGKTFKTAKANLMIFYRKIARKIRIWKENEGLAGRQGVIGIFVNFCTNFINKKMKKCQNLEIGP